MRHKPLLSGASGNLKKGDVEYDVYMKNSDKRVNLRDRRKKMGMPSRPNRKIHRNANTVKTTNISNKHVDFAETGVNPISKVGEVSNTMVLSAYGKKVVYNNLKARIINLI